MNFVKNKTIEEILSVHTDKIPVLLNKNKRSNITELNKEKYLVNKDMSMAQFTYKIRERLKLKAYEALFFHCEGHIISGQVTMSELYHKHKNQDEILYILYSSEEVFG
jgi:hypothetical protein